MKKITEKDMGRALFESTQNISDKELSQVISRFVALIAKKRMLSKTRGIIAQYQKLYNTSNNIAVAQTTVLSRVTPELRHEIREFVKKETNAKEVELEEMVDQRILGGIRVQVGDSVYDRTLKKTLKELQTHLTH